MSFAKILKRILVDRRITVSQLSERTDVPAKTIYHWLNGQLPRKMDHVFRLCDFLDISVEELYGREKKIKSKPLPAQDVLLEDLRAGLYELIIRPAQPRTAAADDSEDKFKL